MKSTLYLQPSGLGDMLNQINIFYHLADIYSFTPKIIINDDGQSRNSLESAKFFEEIGLSSIFEKSSILNKGIEIESQLRHGSIPLLSKFAAPVARYYRFDNASYLPDSVISKILKGDRDEIHPTLFSLAADSTLRARIKAQSREGNFLTVHIRRGDVARVSTNDHAGIFTADAADMIFHIGGVCAAADIWGILPDAHRSRFAQAEVFSRAVDLVQQSHGLDKYNVVSDGYTKLAQLIAREYAHMLRDPSQTPEALEALFEAELAPLTQGSMESYIGENTGNLYQTIFMALSSKVVLSRSPGFLRILSKLFDLEVEFLGPWQVIENAESNEGGSRVSPL